MHKIPVIRLYFLLDALHVSDYASPSSGATFYKLYIAFGIYRHIPNAMYSLLVYIHTNLHFTLNIVAYNT